MSSPLLMRSRPMVSRPADIDHQKCGEGAAQGRSFPWHDPDRVRGILGTHALRDYRGLFVATLLTLLFLPAFCVAWLRIKQPAKVRQPGISEAAHAGAI